MASEQASVALALGIFFSLGFPLGCTGLSMSFPRFSYVAQLFPFTIQRPEKRPSLQMDIGWVSSTKEADGRGCVVSRILKGYYIE